MSLIFIPVFLFMGVFALLLGVMMIIVLVKMGWMGLMSLGSLGLVLLGMVIAGIVITERHVPAYAPPIVVHQPAPPHHHPHKRPHRPGHPMPPEQVIESVPDTSGLALTESPVENSAETIQAEPPVPARPEQILVNETSDQENAPDQPLQIRELLRNSSGQIIATSTTDRVPAWTELPETKQIDSEIPSVLKSERFATSEEARHQLLEQLRKLMIKQTKTEGIRTSRWSPSLTEVERMGLISRECDVTQPLTVGEFTEEVHQVFWQVQLTPAAWRKIVVADRLRKLVAAFGVATFLLGAAAFVLRRRTPTPAT